MDCTGYTDYMDFLVIWNTCNLRIISIFWIIWIIRIVRIIRVIWIIWIIWIICNIRSIRIIWIIWTIWIVDCTDSSYFVSWKRSPRKRPRPGTRKGINRAAAWRACERPLGALLVNHLGWNFPTEFRAVAVKHSYRESGRPSSGPAAEWLGGLCWGLLGLVGP